MARLQISREQLHDALTMPEQVIDLRAGRIVLQRRYSTGSPPREYLLRVFVDIDREPPEVATVYRTSKVEKYWIQT